MMRLNTTLGFLVILSLSLYSCSGDADVAKLETIAVDEALADLRENVPLSTIATDTRYIHLETTAESLVEKIIQVVLHEKYIFILGRRQLLQFDVDGNFLRTIGQVGQGPGEYQRLYNLSIHSSNSYFSVLDGENLKVIHYEMDGEFLSEFPLDSRPNRIGYSQDGLLLVAWGTPDFVLNHQYGINAYDQRGQLIKQMLDRSAEGLTMNDEKRIPSSSITRLEIMNEHLLYWEPESEIIYRYANEAFEPYVRIQTSDERPERSDEPGHIPANMYRYSDFLESDRHFFLSWGVYDQQVFQLQYDKQEKKAWTYRAATIPKRYRIETGFVNDLDGGYPFLPREQGGENQLLTWFYGADLRTISKIPAYDRLTTPHRSNEVSDIIKSAKETDNPIIMIVDLK